MVPKQASCSFVEVNLHHLIEALILQSLNWHLPFEIKCKASYDALRVILGGQEANYYMLREQDTCQSSYALHNDGEGDTSSSLCLREILVLHLRE